jgi:WD40 repeat protein
MIIGGSDDNTIRLWNISDSSLSRIFNGHNDTVNIIKLLQNYFLIYGYFIFIIT